MRPRRPPRRRPLLLATASEKLSPVPTPLSCRTSGGSLAQRSIDCRFASEQKTQSGRSEPARFVDWNDSGSPTTSRDPPGRTPAIVPTHQAWRLDDRTAALRGGCSSRPTIARLLFLVHLDTLPPGRSARSRSWRSGSQSVCWRPGQGRPSKQSSWSTPWPRCTNIGHVLPVDPVIASRLEQQSARRFAGGCFVAEQKSSDHYGAVLRFVRTGGRRL